MSNSSTSKENECESFNVSFTPFLALFLSHHFFRPFFSLFSNMIQLPTIKKRFKLRRKIFSLAISSLTNFLLAKIINFTFGRNWDLKGLARLKWTRSSLDSAQILKIFMNIQDKEKLVLVKFVCVMKTLYKKLTIRPLFDAPTVIRICKLFSPKTFLIRQKIFFTKTK